MIETVGHIKCECGGVLAQATLRNFDASVDTGKRTILAMADGYRCDRCGGETLDGSMVNMLMRRRGARDDSLRMADEQVVSHMPDKSCAEFPEHVTAVTLTARKVGKP